MLRWLTSLCVLCAAVVLAAIEDSDKSGHLAIPDEYLRELETVFADRMSPAARARDLQQSWTQFNEYFNGVPTAGSPGNLPTFFGPNPGPCAYGYANRRSTRCKGRICALPASVKAIQITLVLWTKRLDEWFETNDCTNFPGIVYLYNTDFGDVTIGGIYLDIVAVDASDTQNPSPQGFAPTPSIYISERSSRNRFRVLFTLNQIQVTLDTRLEIERLRLKRFKALDLWPDFLDVYFGPFDFNKDNLGMDLRRSRQPISSSQHAISFRTLLYFRSNQACNFRSPRSSPTVTQFLDTTCIYRSDKVTPTTRQNYYRGLNGAANQLDRRTETFTEGVVFDINLERNADNTWAPASCQFDFANPYATQSPGANHNAALGVYIDIGPTCQIIGYEICQPVINWVLNDIILPLILKDILCQLINGMFYPTDNNGVISTNRGVINAGILSLYEFFRKYVETPLTSKASAEYVEDVDMPQKFRNAGYLWSNPGCAASSYCPYPPAVNFNTSGIFKSVSLGLNNILGNVSTTPVYAQQNKLAIVEVIDILLGNKVGVVKLGICPPGVPATCTLGLDCAGVCDGDIKAELKLQDYPRFEWTGEPVFDGYIQLNGMALYGVNSITRLKILDNGFADAQDTTPEYTHTVKNSFAMQYFGLEFDFLLVLRDGYWVARPRYQAIGNRPKRQITMRAGMYIELINIAFDIDLFLLLRPDLIADKKIGGIFGNFPDGKLMDRVRCAAFAMDAFQLSRLQLTGSLNVLRFQNLFGDLSTVISRGVDIFNLGYKSATALYLPFLADNWARPRINEILYTSTFDGDCYPLNPLVPGVNCKRTKSNDTCLPYPYYFSNTDPNRHINFYDSRVWNVIKGVVNDVVGGIPVRTGSASINTIIDTYLIWYLPILERDTGVQLIKLPNVPTGPNPEVGNIDAPNRILIQADVGGNGNPNNEKFIEFSNFGVRNLETIHELSIKPTTAAQPRKFRLDFKLGSGKIWDRFNNKYITNGLLGFKFHLKMEITDNTEGVDVTYAMDEADIFIQFGNLTVGTDIFALVNQNEFLDLTWSNLLDVACLLALVDDFNMETLTIGFQSFRLKIDRSGPNWRNRDKNCNNDWVVPIPCASPTPCTLPPSTNHGTPCGGDPDHFVLRFSDALDRLAWEATSWGAVVDNMVKYFFIGVANSTRNAVNVFAKRQIPVLGCANYSVFGGNSPLGFIDRITKNATTVSEGFFAFWEKISVNQMNPRFPQVLQSAPTTTMLGSRKTCTPPIPAGLCINYAVDDTPPEYLPKAGFPAARCNRGPSRKYADWIARDDACWEDKVLVSRADEDAIDLRSTFVVTELQNFLSKAGRKVVIDALDALASTSGNIIGDSIISYPNGTMLPDGRGRCINVIQGEASYCIDIDIDLDRAANASNVSKPLFTNDLFIPGFALYFKRLRIYNFHTFDADPESFDLLEPYVPDMYNPSTLRDTDARFTLAHRIKFSTGTGSLLRFALTVDISVADEFLRLNSPTPKKPVTDSMTLEFQFKDLDVQALTLTAMNKTRIEEVPFYYFLDPFGPERCFFSIFFENGLSLPQFQVYVSNIIGPQVNITGKSPLSAKPNIFSPGIGELITSSIEIVVQLIKEDLPDATQGEFRKYINRVLKEVYLDPAISASRSPGSCPPPDACGPPDSWCHYQNFMASTFTPIFDALNTAVGGNPVKTSQVDVNSLVELGLNYSIMSPTGPQIFGNKSGIQHPAAGDWIMPTVLDYINGPSRVKLTNVGLFGLDSIYKLTFQRYPAKPYSLSFALEMGNGTLLDGSKQPATPFRADPLVIQAEFDAVVVAQRPAPQAAETLANNQFRVQLAFSGINITSMQQILFNKTDLLLLNINQVTNTQCALSIIDKITLETVSVQIADFDVTIPPNDCGNVQCVAPGFFGRNPTNCRGTGIKCNLGNAITQLRIEAGNNNPIRPPQQSRPLSMLNTVLRNIGGSVVTGFNSITIWNKTRESCDVPKLIMDIISGVTNSTHASQLSNRLANNVTGVLERPLPVVSADFTSVTVQSHRLANNDDRATFIAELIQSAKDARGRKPAPEVVLREGSICNELNLPTIIRPLCTSFATGTSNISAKITEWTSQQPNLIEEQRDPRNIEDRVRIDLNKEKYYDVRTSTIVKSVTGYFDSNFQRLNTLLENIANSTSILRVETDGSVTLVANITDAFFWIDENILAGKTCEGEQKRPKFLLQDLLKESNWLIPRFRILPGMLEVRNFGSFSELIILRPYVAQGEAARFTTRHEFGWRNPSKPLNITASIDLFFDKSFVAQVSPGQIEKDTINITLGAQDLLVQVLTLLAVNTKELGEIRLGDFLNVDITQEFKRNCKAVTCLMKSIFDGGLYIPQLTVNVTNIIGPQFKTTGKLFSSGVEQLVDALLEIVVQLFRDDLAALTQGPLREAINDALVQSLGESKVDGACPPRRNYTQDYPLGQYFCSHNDTAGVSPLLTQSEAICRSKYNGRACKWSPPDGEITETTVACIYTQEVRVINFQTSRGLAQLKNFVNGSLMNPDSALYLNKYLSAFASSFQTKLYEVDGFPLKYNGKEYGTVRLGIGKFSVSNLDTVDRFQLLDPAPWKVGGDSRFVNGEEYEPAPPRRLLMNTYSDSQVEMVRRELADRPDFGYVDNKYMSRTAIGWNGGLGRPLSVYFEILFSFDELFVPRPDGPQDFVENHVSIRFNLYDFDFAIDLYMLVNIPRLMDLQIRSIGTPYELPCILAIFEDNGLIPTRANITYGTVGFELQCVNRCDSPFFSPLKNGGFSDSTSLSLRESFTRTFQKITDFLIKLLASSDAQDFLDRQISISNQQCEAIKTGIKLPDFGETQTHPDAASAMGIAGLASLFAAFVGFALLVPVHFRRRDELMKRALLDAHARGAEGKSKDEFELAERRLMSAFAHPMMPVWAKFLLPFMILINIIMFATANFAGAGAIVELTLSIAGDTTYPITLLPFTLSSSINDMWAAGVYPLAIIIALASGGWPYAKQLLMIFCWFAPATVLHPNARGRMLEILDSLGKWSLIDIYVLVMLMVGFRFYLSSSLVESFSLLPPDVLVVDVVVTPGWGIFGFMLGAMGSLVVNHIMIWQHRKIVRMDEDLQDAILGTLVKDLRTPRIPLSRHRFNILDAEGRPYRYSIAVRVMFVFTFALTWLLLIIGAVIPVIKFQFKGLAGLAIAFLDQNLASSVHSVVSVGTSLIDGARNTPESVLGVLFIQILYILFSLVIPLILCILLVAIWVVPLTLREQLLLYFVAEVLSAWEAVAVLIVSFIAAVLQISQLAQFIVEATTGNICSAVETQLERFFPDPSDAKCFNVIASLVPSSAVIIIAAVLMFIACAVGFRLIHAAVTDRELAMRRKPPHSPGEMTGLTGFIVRRSLEAFGASQVQNAGSVLNLYAQGQGAFDPRDSQLAPANPILAREMPQSISGMQAGNPMFHGSVGGMSRGTHQSIDV